MGVESEISCIFVGEILIYRNKTMMNETKRPLILVSNDDGVNAKGLKELIEMIRPLGEVVVMAPDGARSGYAGSITCKDPVRFSLVSREEGLTIYQCTGTPVDCIKLALGELLTERPTLVVSGINHGHNSASSVHYSGTLGVVFEGCMKGIPSVGFSLDTFAADADFSPLTPYVRRIAEQVLAKGLPEGSCLNVNFPALPEFAGVKVCHQTRGQWAKEWVPCEHPRGGTYYWLTGGFEPAEQGVDADYCAMKQGYVAVTPIRMDMTDYALLESLREWNLK